LFLESTLDVLFWQELGLRINRFFVAAPGKGKSSKKRTG
jgi:hypothetical protein